MKAMNNHKLYDTMNNYKLYDTNEILNIFPELKNKIQGIGFKNAVEVIINYLELKHFPLHTLFVSKEGIIYFIIKTIVTDEEQHIKEEEALNYELDKIKNESKPISCSATPTVDPVWTQDPRNFLTKY